MLPIAANWCRISSIHSVTLLGAILHWWLMFGARRREPSASTLLRKALWLWFQLFFAAGKWREHESMMRKWWEPDGKLMGNDGNMMGKWREHGETMMGTWWETGRLTWKLVRTCDDGDMTGWSSDGYQRWPMLGHLPWNWWVNSFSWKIWKVVNSRCENWRCNI